MTSSLDFERLEKNKKEKRKEEDTKETVICENNSEENQICKWFWEKIMLNFENRKEMFSLLN